MKLDYNFDPATGIAGGGGVGDYTKALMGDENKKEKLGVPADENNTQTAAGKQGTEDTSTKSITMEDFH